jgi:hypothetical protein
MGPGQPRRADELLGRVGRAKTMGPWVRFFHPARTLLL